MSKVFVGSISPESEALLTKYLDEFMPDAVIEPLKAAGIKGKIKNQGVRPDVVLIIIDEGLYQACVGVAEDVLSLPKVHKYEDDDGLKQFLISKFGKLEEDDISSGLEEPLVTTFDDVVEEEPEEKSLGVLQSVAEDEFDNLSVSTPDISESTSSDSSSVVDATLIAKLQDELAQSKLMVRNLTLQIEEKNGDDDISAFIARIKELEQEVANKEMELEKSSSDSYINLGKVARAEQIISQVDSLKEDLKLEKENSSALVFEKSKLEASVEDLNKTIDALNTIIENLNESEAELKESNKKLTEELEQKETELATKSQELDNKNIELNGKDEELTILQSSLENMNNLEEELNQTKAQLSDKELELNNLKVDFNTNSEDITSLKEELEKAKSKLADKDSEIGNSLEGIKEYESKVTELTEKVQGYEALIKDYEDKITESDNKILELASRIEELSSNSDTISELETQISNLKSDLEALTNDLNSANVKLSEKTSELEVKESEIADLKTELENAGNDKDSYNELKEQFDIQSEAYDKVLKEKEELEDKIVNAETNNLALSDRINELEKSQELASSDSEAQMKAYEQVISEKKELEDKLVESETNNINLNSTIEDLTNEVSAKDTELSELRSVKVKLENTINSLNKNIEDMNSDADKVKDIESSLIEERRKTAKLNSELEILRKNDSSTKVADLRIEIATLRNKLEKQSGVSNTEEVTRLNNEIVSLRERCASLEMDLVDKNYQIDEINSNIFTQMINVSLPKVVNNCCLSVPNDLSSKFVCVASGSAESLASTYQMLRRTCTAESKKRILIVDLVTDSYIDLDFGIQKIVTPIDWLSGAKNFKDYITNTRLNNVKVISTALAYLNDMYLLQVDWKARLKELDGFADVVILNIGCMDNLVTRILFNSFINIMSTHIIVKATPVNLRASILNLAGVQVKEGMLTVGCVNFDANASKAMYQRLVSKYNSRIYKDSDILQI